MSPSREQRSSNPRQAYGDHLKHGKVDLLRLPHAQLFTPIPTCGRMVNVVLAVISRRNAERGSNDALCSGTICSCTAVCVLVQQLQGSSTNCSKKDINSMALANAVMPATRLYSTCQQLMLTAKKRATYVKLTKPMTKPTLINETGCTSWHA